VVTVDLAVPGARYRDIRSGMMGGVPLAGRLALAADLLRHAGWVWDVALRGRPLVFGTIAPILPKAHMLRDFVGWVGKNFDAGVTWKDVEWIRARWNGPLIVKGVLDPDDARAAVHAGAQAVVVSNHGGRQLDSVPSTVAALPAIVDAVGGSAEVLFDGGVRSGLDVFKALALGAKGALMGRAWAFALAALGESGVTRMLGTVQKELDAAMALSGVTSIAEIGRDALVRDPTAPAVEIRR
jgi:L-lactate dehydrogenase (cytochrome)